MGVALSWHWVLSSKADVQTHTVLPGTSNIPEATIMKNALPLHCSVEYYQPTHDDNPTRIGNINDEGVDEGCEGIWTCVMTAPHLQHLALTFDAFVEHYMGVGKPMRDNFFRHDKSSHKFLSRKTNP